MGQKVHPYGFRLVSIRKPRSRWFAEGERYRRQLIEDIKIREYIHDKQRNAAISDIIIDRTADTVTVTIEAARPGIMIGRGGRDVDRLRQQLQKTVDTKVRINVEETSQPDTCAQLVAENIAWQIERRVSPRRAMGQAMERALERGAKGVRCEIAGRINGAEIARREKMGPEGPVPLQTLRAEIDYGITEAKTSYGNIGVKVWIYKGEVLPPKKREEKDVWEELEEEALRMEREEGLEAEMAPSVEAEAAEAAVEAGAEEAELEAEEELPESDAAEPEAVEAAVEAGAEEAELEAEEEPPESDAAEPEAVEAAVEAGAEEAELEAEEELPESDAAEPTEVDEVDEVASQSDEPVEESEAAEQEASQPTVAVEAIEEDVEDVDA